MSLDPYAALLKPTPPRDRRRPPLDPSESYATKFTRVPVISNPQSGSFDYRWRALNGQSWAMTIKEQQFEDYVNEWQARLDEDSDFSEWRRLKDREEEAIALYYDLGENLQEYTAQMRTRDQMEIEFQCQRKRQIERNLDPLRASVAITTLKEAVEQWRTRMDFKNGVWARMANTEIITHATAPQQAEKQSEFTESKPEKLDNTCQRVSSAAVGPSRQQEQKKKLSPLAAAFEYGPGRPSELLPTATMPTRTTYVLPIRSKPAASTNITLGCPAKAEQSLARNIDQPPDTSLEKPATGSTEQSSGNTSPRSRGSSTSTQQPPNKKETPPSSTSPSPTRPPNDPSSLHNRLPERERLQHSTVRPEPRSSALSKPSIWKDPSLNAIFEERMEHLRKKIGEHEREKRSAQDAEWAELDQLCWMAWEGGVEEEEEPSKGNDVMSEMKARVDQLDLSIGALAQSDLSK